MGFSDRFRKTRTFSPGYRPARPPVRIVRDDTGRPAVDLGKIQEAGHVSLVKKADAVGLALGLRGLRGIRANVITVLDRSGSMYRDYASGAVQQLVERALGFALQVDVDGMIPVIGFADDADAPVDVTVANYQGVIGRDIAMPYGTTNMTAAMAVVRQYAEVTDLPLIVIVVADGGPDDPASTTRAFCELAAYPVFFKLLAVRPVDYFATLDDLGGDRRLLDNVDAKPERGGKDLLAMDDTEFATAMVDEFEAWITLATAAGVLAAP